MRLADSFYQRNDVVRIARDLLGKALFTNIDGVVTGGVIVETEAYSWKERGCHAYGKKKTPRNAVMFEGGGLTYVYLCYGMHHLFNVVTNVADIPEAVLVRALQPTHGVAEMEIRRQGIRSPIQLTSGPGKLTKALGIDRKMNGKSLDGYDIWIEESDFRVGPRSIGRSPRIGIDYAGKDALLPWRFFIKKNPWVSGV